MLKDQPQGSVDGLLNALRWAYKFSFSLALWKNCFYVCHRAVLTQYAISEFSCASVSKRV